MMFRVFLLPALIWLLASGDVLAGGNDIAGNWRTADGRAEIQIYHCLDMICGRVVWLREPCFPAGDRDGMAGQQRIDRYNPTPALRSRRVVGLQIMDGFIKSSTGRWEQGSIYDADTGRTYRARMTLLSADRLELRGYIAVPLLGRSSVWTRVE